MKLTTLLFISTAFVLTTACGQSYSEDYYGEGSYYSEESYDSYGQQDMSSAQTAGYDGKVIMHPSKDPKTGIITAHVPLPSNWKVTPQGWTGPDNTQVQEQKGGYFLQQQRPIHSIDQLIREDVIPKLRQNGMQVINTINLPQVARCDQQMFAQYWKAMPAQDYHEVKGVEFKDANGTPGLGVVHFINSRSQYGNAVMYYFHVMQAPASQYEQAKKVVINALANIRLNPQFVALHNQKEQQKSQASWSAHNQKMRNNQRNFNNWQQTQKTLSDVSDIYMDTWRSTNAASDRMQEQTVDGIWGRENVTDPYNGQQWKVESGYNNYYMNNNGEYIGTDDEFYNPNQDPYLNNQDWREVNPGGGY